MAKLAVWPYVINSITVRKKTSKNGKGEDKVTETWIFRVSPGNENFGGEEKVLIRFKGTHSWPSQKRFQDLIADKSFDTNGEINISEIPENLQTLSSEGAWDPNRSFGTTGLVFQSIPFNPEDPTEEFCVWDPDKGSALLDKNGKKIIRTQDMVAITCVWTPDPETGDGTWVSEFGGSLEEGLRTEMSTQISRNRYKPVGKVQINLNAGGATPPEADPNAE